MEKVIMGILNDVLGENLKNLGGTQMGKNNKGTKMGNMTKEDLFATAAKAFGLVDEEIVKEEQKINKENIEEAQTEEIPKEEAAKIMEEINAAVDGKEKEVIVDEVSELIDSEILLLNKDILNAHGVAEELTAEPTLNAAIISILKQVFKWNFKGYLRNERKEVIKNFLLSISNGHTEIQILPAGKIAFYTAGKTDKPKAKFNVPKIVQLNEIEVVNITSSKNTIMNINEEIINDIHNYVTARKTGIFA